MLMTLLTSIANRFRLQAKKVESLSLSLSLCLTVGVGSAVVWDVVISEGVAVLLRVVLN